MDTAVRGSARACAHLRETRARIQKGKDPVRTRSRKGAIGGTVALVAANVAALIAPAGPAGAVNFSNVCVQNLAPGGTPLSTDLTGTAPASTTPGGSVALSNLSMTRVPAR